MDNYGIEKNICGVYMLMKGTNILYVGQSRDVKTRVYQHKDRIPFDSVKVIKCKPDKLLQTETKLILRHRPQYNNCSVKRHVDREPSSPVTAAQIKVTPALIRQLERSGYTVRRRPKLIRKTFVVDQDSLEKFLKTRITYGIKMQDAVSEALLDWANKKK